MLYDRNQLPIPEFTQKPDFETKYAEFVTSFIANLAELDPDKAAEVEETLATDGELISKLIQHFCLFLLEDIEAQNEKARQVLPGYAKGNNLEHVVANHGIERQTLSPGDPSAIPAIPAVRESDDNLLQRFFLAPHAPAAGSRSQYKFQALTIGDRPVISVDRPSDNTVVVTYVFPDASASVAIRDANARRTADGEVTVTVLSSDGDGVADQVLLDIVAAHFAREDVRPETDKVLVQSATLANFSIDVQVALTDGPDVSVIQGQIYSALVDYKDSSKRLGGEVLRSYIDHVCHKHGAKRIIINQPAVDVDAFYYQAPHGTSVNVSVVTYEP